MEFFSPAKLNLFLKVVKKREDGYHELASLFQAVSLFDTLDISFSDHDSFEIAGIELPVDENNLVSRALNLFRAKSQLNFNVNIKLDKKIPIQAGLGGGSSNAATTLWALNEIHGFPILITDLYEWSKELGSDITFFLSSGTAFCTGRGEIVYSLPPLLEERRCTIVKPKFGLSTPQVFKAFQLEKVKSKNTIYYNDLEEAAFSVNPKLFEIKNDLLTAGFEEVVMSGSGTSFFCFGNGDVKEDLDVFPIHFVHRNLNNWYSPYNLSRTLS